ncbi:MAG: DUF2065 domain-containing protein [Gammaproteobacteria bacterium]
MLTDLLAAVALMLVFEGIMPFLDPGRFRRTLMGVSQFNDQALRLLGGLSMAGGVLLLYLVR